MTNPDLIKLDALEFLWRSLQASPDFEASRNEYSRAFSALVLSELSVHLRVPSSDVTADRYAVAA